MIYKVDTDIPVTRPHYTTRGEVVEFSYDVEGREGYSLKADANAAYTIEGRPVGAGSFTNLATTPIALDAYIGLRQEFEFQITPNAYTEDTRVPWRIYAAKL